MSQLRNALRRAGSCAAALALIASTAVVLAPSVAADTGTRYVATNGDDTVPGGGANDCKTETSPCQHIQYAVDQSDGGDTIHVRAGTYAESVRIRKSLTIVGAGTGGADDTIVSGSTDSGDRSIFIDGTDTDTPLEVTVTNLDVSGNADDDGILVDDATLHLRDSVVSNNDSDGLGVLGASTATVDGSTIHGNGDDGVTLNREGGASPSVTVSNSVVSGNGDGGVIIEAGDALVENTTLDKNVGAGVVADGDGTHATVNTSTISDTAPFTSGERNPFGAGVLVFPGGAADISTSTIAGNTGQGVYSLGGTVTITDSTIAGTKSAPPGDLASGGVVNDGEGPGVSVVGTIIATQAAGVPDCSGVITDGGYNLDSDAKNSCAFAPGDHDVVSRDPKLGALQDNGGPTLTMMLGAGSPARDAIPTTDGTTCNSDFGTDQRGDARPIGPGCDIGAVEAPMASPPPPPTCSPLVIDTSTLPDGTVGAPYSLQLKASGGCDSAYTWTVPAEAPEGGFPPAGTQSTAPGRGQNPAARPALGVRTPRPSPAPPSPTPTHPTFTPTVHSSSVAAPTSSTAAATQSTGTGEAAGNSVPPGLTLDADGLLSGTPTQAGTFTFTVSVNDPVLTTLVLHVAAAATGTPTSPATTPAPSTSHGVGGVSTTAAPPVTATSSAGSGPLANTGASVGPQLRLALLLLVGGGALLLAGARRRRSPRQH